MIALFVCMSTFPFSHTLIGSLLMTLNLYIHIGCFVSIVQVLDETIHVARSWSLSLPDTCFLSLLPSFIFVIIL